LDAKHCAASVNYSKWIIACGLMHGFRGGWSGSMISRRYLSSNSRLGTAQILGLDVER
jgi:hypothetical protein